jgi:predicted  nucleic acid-binding Zn-ribbon protein
MKQNYLLLISLFVIGPLLGFAQTISTQKGLTTAVFNLPAGAIKVYVPDDIRPGETISGTVTAEPVGRNAKQLEKNLTELKKYSVNFNGENFSVNNTNTPFQTVFNANKPASGRLQLMMDIKTVEGEVVDVRVPNISPKAVPAGCAIPAHALSAAPLRITGPFDGDASNTRCSLDNKALEILAESPRQCIVSFPADAKGTQNLNIQEKNAQPCIKNVSAVNMDVTSGKLNLLRGEKTYIDVKISGLQGLTGLALLTVENSTTNIVSMQPANNVIVPLNPDSVGSGGFSRHFNLQSINNGAFSVNVNLNLPDAVKDVYADIPKTDGNNKTDTVPCKDLEEKVKAAEEALEKLKTELAGIDNLINGTQKSLDDCNKALEGLLKVYHEKKKVFDDRDNNRKNWEKSGKSLNTENQKKFDDAKSEKETAAKEWSDQKKKCNALEAELNALKARKAALPGLIKTGEGELKGVKDELEKCKTKAAEDKKKKEEEERKKTEAQPQPSDGNINPGTGADKEGSPCNPEGFELVEPVKRVYGSCYVKETEITPCNTDRISNEVLEAVKKAFEKFKKLKGPLEIAEKVAACASTAKAVCVNVHVVRNWEDVQLTYVCVNGKWVLKNRKVTGRGEDDYGWFTAKDKEIGNTCCWIFGKKEDGEKIMEAHLKEAIQEILDACK